MNGLENQLEGIYVNPAVGNFTNHPQMNEIHEIFRESEWCYFHQLSEIFEKNPQLYAKIENIIFQKHQLSGLSLLEVLNRQGQGLLHSMLIFPNYEEHRKKVLFALFSECQKEARIAIRNAYYQNGHRIAKIIAPDFTRFINEASKREERVNKARLNERLLNSYIKNFDREKPINLINSMTKLRRQKRTR